MIDSKKILVTGGSGFIGSNLVDFLILQGHRVLVIDDLSTGLEINQNPEADYCHMDLVDAINNPNLLVNLLSEYEIEIVYHLAASADISLSMRKPATVYEINLLSSIALIGACEQCRVKRFIFASTSAVYGEPEYFPVDEEHKTSPISPYGLTKLNFEQYLSFFSRSANISSTAFRFPNVYGPRQRPDLEGGVIAIFFNSMKQGLPITIYGDGKQTRDWVYVDDIVDALNAARTRNNSKFEVLSLGSNRENSIDDLVECLKIVTQYKLRPIYADPRPGDIKKMVMSFSGASETYSWKPKISLLEGIKKISEYK